MFELVNEGGFWRFAYLRKNFRGEVVKRDFSMSDFYLTREGAREAAYALYRKWRDG